MDTADLLMLIRRRLALILILTTLGLVLAVYQTSKIVPMYSATSSIFVSTPPSLNDPLQTSGNKLGELATGNNFTQARVKSYATIVNNASTLEPVIAELKLPMSVPELAAQVSAVAPADTVLMYVTVVNPDPVLAAKIANSVANHFSETVLTIELNSSLDLTQLIKLSVVRNAEPNFTPVSPRKNLNYLLGIFGGGILALLISLFLRYLDKSMKSEKDLGETPLFGVVAFDPEAGMNPLIPNLGTYATRTEAFRLFRTNMLHALDNKEDNCVAMSSCFSGEGKTTSTLNLGFSIAQAGFKVLIVEADMRRPGLLKYLKTLYPDLEVPASGLSSLLEQKTEQSMKRALNSSIKKIPDSSLEILFSGKVPNNPAELLGSDNFVDLIEILKGKYDYVLIDTPPVLAVADTSIVCRVTGNISLVLHAGKTSKRNFEAAREAVTGVGVAITGVLLNKVPKHKAGEHYGYTYSDPKMGYYRYSYDYTPQSALQEDEKKPRSLQKFKLPKIQEKEKVKQESKEISKKAELPKNDDESFQEFLKKYNID